MRTAAEAGRFDMIVHIGSLPDSGMVAYPVAPNNRFICAAPAYLQRHPAPRDSKEVAVRVPAILSSNDGDVVKQWTLAGALPAGAAVAAGTAEEEQGPGARGEGHPGLSAAAHRRRSAGLTARLVGSASISPAPNPSSLAPSP